MNVWLVTSDLDRLKAQQVISRSHYLVAPQRGYILACGFSNVGVQNRIRAAARRQHRRSPDPWSSAWTEDAGGIVACATLDTLTHGNPCLRAAFAVGEIGPRWRTLHRGTLVERLRLAWASRFAVDAPYRGIGLGTLLAEQLKVIAARYRELPARYVEVITTHRQEAADALLADQAGKHDFLVNAGYVRVGALRRSAKLGVLNSCTGIRELRPARKLYYYAKL